MNCARGLGCSFRVGLALGHYMSRSLRTCWKLVLRPGTEHERRKVSTCARHPEACVSLPKEKADLMSPRMALRP